MTDDRNIDPDTGEITTPRVTHVPGQESMQIIDQHAEHTQADDGTSTSITQFLEQIKQGAFVDAASEALAQLVRTCTSLERPGTFTVTFKVKPQNNFLLVDAQYAASPPKGDPFGSIWYPDAKGGLHRNDPDAPPTFSF